MKLILFLALVLSSVNSYCASLLTSPKTKSESNPIHPAKLVRALYAEERKKLSAGIISLSAIKSMQQLEQEVEDAGANTECDLASAKICQIIWTDEHRKYFSDVEALPIGGGDSIKIGLIRYQIQLGDNLQIPFSLLASDTSSSARDDDANLLKLLDPEQGLNFSTNWAWKYRIKDFCSFSNTSLHNGFCRFGLNVGARYLKLDEIADNDEEDIIGGYIEIANAWRFPVYEAKNMGEEAGYVNWYTSASFFSHNGDSSNKFFQNVTDNDGNPVNFDKDFGSFTMRFELYITNQITVTYSYYDPFESDGLDDVSSFTFKYNFENNQK